MELQWSVNFSKAHDALCCRHIIGLIFSFLIEAKNLIIPDLSWSPGFLINTFFL